MFNTHGVRSLPNWLLAVVVISLTVSVIFYGGIETHITLLMASIGGVLLALSPLLSFNHLTRTQRFLLIYIAVHGFVLAFQTSLMVLPQLISLLSLNLIRDMPLDSFEYLRSSTPGKSIINLSLMLGYLGFTIITIFLAANSNYAHKIRVYVSIVISLFAAYAIFEFLLGNNHTLWLKKTAYIDSLTGTFINRNFASNFLGIGLITSISIALSTIGEISSKHSFRQKIDIFYQSVLKERIIWLILSLICLVAMVLTSSRAGLLATIIGILTLFLSLLIARPPLRLLIGSITLIFISFFIILLSLGTQVSARLVSAETQSRSIINALSYSVIDSNGLLGSGLGSWSDLANMNRIDQLNIHVGRLEYAHNSYLQWAVETGTLGVLIALSMLVVITYTLIKGLKVRRRQVIWPAMGLAILVQQLLHGWPDAPLILPAIFLTVTVLLITSLMQSTSPDKVDGVQTLNYRTLTILIAVLGVLGSVLSVILLTAEVQYYNTKRVTHALDNGATVDSKVLSESASGLRKCLEINPTHSKCGEDLTLNLMNQAYKTGVNTGNGEILLSLAIRQGKLAISENPIQPSLKYRMARIELLLSNPKQSILYLIDSIQSLPSERNLALHRVTLMPYLYQYMNDQQKAVIHKNLRQLWNLDSNLLWKTISPLQHSEKVLRSALVEFGHDPDFIMQWKKTTRIDW